VPVVAVPVVAVPVVAVPVVPVVPVPVVPVPVVPVVPVPVPVVPVPGVVTLVTDEKGTVLLPTLSNGPVDVSWIPDTTPVTELPVSSVPVTFWPSMDVAAPACCELTRLASDVWREPSSCTSSKSAVWERNWVESTGSSGFWYCIWATSNFKKVSALTPLEPRPSLVELDAELALAVSPAGSTAVGWLLVAVVPEISLI
jgi:hypothetical protein